MPGRIRPTIDPQFAAELRRLRTQRGLSLRGLAALVYQGKSHLGQIEQGQAAPTDDLAQRLDTALEAGGRLAALARSRPGQPDEGAARIAYAVRHPGRVDPGTIDALADVLAGQRRLDDVLGAAAVLPAVHAHLDLITRLTADARDDLRPRLVDLAAQWAQFAGWLGIAEGNHPLARRWLAQALEWAIEADNPALVGTVLSFRADLAGYAGDLGSMIGVTRAALSQPNMSPGQLAYDHYQLARGYARAGEARSAAETLAAADDRVPAAIALTTAGPPWDYYRDRAFFDLEAGTTWAELGQHERAVELLTAGLAGLTSDATHADWTGTYLCRLAESGLAIGERDVASGAAERAGAIAERNNSSRLVAAVQRLSTSLDDHGTRRTHLR